MKQYFTHGASRTDFRTLAEWLKAHEPFKTANGNFHGGIWEDYPGRLDEDPIYRGEYMRRGAAGQIDYVVYSYQTPIAWHDVDWGWIDPGHGYSQTTKAKHYGPTTTALYVLMGEK